MQGKIYGIGVDRGSGAYDIEGGAPDPGGGRDRDSGKEKETCTAYQIALGAVPEIEEKEIIPVVFPMTKDEAVLKESHEAAVKSLAASWIRERRWRF